MRRAATAVLAALIALPAAAQSSSPAPSPAPSASAAPDAERQALGTQVAARLFPVGTYQRMMTGTMDKLMDSVMGSVGTMPLAQLATMGGLSTEQAADLPPVTLDQIMAIYDPHYRERSQIEMRAMMAAMGELMGRFEPRMRAALAAAYARRFTAPQLREMNAFFATPTGGAFAAESMTIFMDPEMMQEMQGMMPAVMEQLPAILKKARAATANLPPPRKLSDLTPAERAKLAQLLGTSEQKLKDPPAAPAIEGNK
ncbi:MULTISPECIES: DUF2059 domain-containing protein [Sphingomonas]|nr:MULTISPECIES: DUF2059 domain-containing protein [Sphingomonas]